jgi:hypothetical protein
MVSKLPVISQKARMRAPQAKTNAASALRQRNAALDHAPCHGADGLRRRVAEEKIQIIPRSKVGTMGAL